MSSRSSALEIAGWQAPSSSDAVTKLRQISPRAVRSIWSNDGTFSPLDLYCYLNARFGTPNGPAMALKAPYADNLIHWEYLLIVDDGLLLIQGNVHAVVFISIGSQRVRDPEWSALATMVKADFKNRGAQMSSIRKRLEKWILFTNPYHRLDRVMTSLESRLRQLDLAEPARTNYIATKGQLRRADEHMQRWVKQVDECHLLATAARMLAPVLGEAFVNLLIFLLVRPDVRSDPQVYESFIRQQIHLRIKSLHLYCGGFAKPVDTSSKSFGDFHSVMNSRNDFLHGNVDPLKLQFGEVLFDGMIPLFRDEESELRRFVRSSLQGVAREQALSDVAAVRHFVAFLQKHLKDDTKQLVDVAMGRGQLGWREDYSRVGVLFPAVIPDFVAVTGR